MAWGSQAWDCGAEPGSGRASGRDRAPVPGQGLGLHGQALPRALGSGRLPVGLHVDQVAAATARAAGTGARAGRAPPQASAPSDGGDDAAPGRQQARVGDGRRSVRSGCDDGRRYE